MGVAQTPASCTARPDGGNHEAVEALAQESLSIVLKHLRTASERSPLPEAAAPGEAALIPEPPRPESDLFEELRGLLTGSMNPAHPGFMEHMDPMPATASVLGNFVASAAKNDMLGREMSPIFSRLEERLCRGIARRFGLGDDYHG